MQIGRFCANVEAVTCAKATKGHELLSLFDPELKIFLSFRHSKPISMVSVNVYDSSKRMKIPAKLYYGLRKRRNRLVDPEANINSNSI
jgi:hypothetical protein